MHNLGKKHRTNSSHAIMKGFRIFFFESSFCLESTEPFETAYFTQTSCFHSIEFTLHSFNFKIILGIAFPKIFLYFMKGCGLKLVLRLFEPGMYSMICIRKLFVYHFLQNIPEIIQLSNVLVKSMIIISVH